MIRVEQPQQTSSGYRFIIYSGSVPFTVELSQADVDKRGGPDNIQATIASKQDQIDNSDLKGDVFKSIVYNVHKQTQDDTVGTTVDPNGTVKTTEQVFPQPTLAQDNLTASVLGQPQLQDLSTVTELKSISSPAAVQGTDFQKNTVIDGPAINPYANINPNKKVSDEIHEIIGGSDLLFLC
jgi:hypothetical protein